MADHAIVIGVDLYPGLRDLAGPGNDAQRFSGWLLDRGGLDPSRLSMLRSQDFPPPTGLDDAQPITHALQRLFRPLVIRAARGEHEDGRLFIFVAGHGFADPQDLDSAALFAADAHTLYPTNLAVVEYVRFFVRMWAFDEVILVMDTCRATNAIHHIEMPPLPRLQPHPQSHRVKLFTAFSAGFTQLARERRFGDEVRGIFTAAFLDALESARPNRLGRVTGTAIKDHIHNRIDAFAGDAQVSPPDIRADSDKDVLFSARPVTTTPVSLRFEDDAAESARRVSVWFGGTEKVLTQETSEAALHVDLPPGLYQARIEGTDRTSNFQVPPDGSIPL